MATTGFQDPGTRRVSVYDPVLSTTYATSSLWRTCPLLEYFADPSIAVMLREDWQSYDAAATDGDYVATQAVSGTAALSTTVPGSMLLDAGASTDNQGINLQRVKSAFLPAANKSIWAEFYVTLTAGTPPVTRAQIFVGLAATDTTIIASGAMSTQNHIGWDILDGELLVSKFTCDKAGVTSRTTGKTFVAATGTRLGFFYDGTADTVQQYIDGVATGSAITTTNIPKAAVIYPSFVCQSDGTDRPNLVLGAYQIFQLR